MLLATLPKDIPLVIMDCVGIQSKEAVRQLMDKGISMVANLAGGIADWEKDGLPMKKEVESMSGQCPCMIKSRSA